MCESATYNYMNCITIPNYRFFLKKNRPWLHVKHLKLKDNYFYSQDNTFESQEILGKNLMWLGNTTLCDDNKVPLIFPFIGVYIIEFGMYVLEVE